MIIIPRRCRKKHWLHYANHLLAFAVQMRANRFRISPMPFEAMEERFAFTRYNAGKLIFVTLSRFIVIALIRRLCTNAGVTEQDAPVISSG